MSYKICKFKATVTGKYNYRYFVFNGNVPFTAKLNNFSWEQVFVVSKKDLGNGKLDIKFKPTEESKISYNMVLYNANNISMSNPNNKKAFPWLKDLDFTTLKNQLKKIFN